MLGNKDKAATSAEATAQNYNQLNESYQSCAPRSSANLKKEIGKLLLYLLTPLNQEQQEKCWQLFESSLTRYVELKICRGTV
jgi:hypothetical protein